MLERKEEYLALKEKVLEKRFSNMNPMQRKAIFQMEGPVLILAGAGSGKTTVIINRIAYMIQFGDAWNSNWMPEGVTEEDLDMLRAYLDGADVSNGELGRIIGCHPLRPWNILAITFTNKAANEMKTRLENMLGEEARDVAADVYKRQGLMKQARVIADDAVSFLSHTAESYDIIFLDPPYDLGFAPKILPLLGRCLSPEGIVLFEHRKGEEMPETVGELQMKKQYTYGKTVVTTYGRAPAAQN